MPTHLNQLPDDPRTRYRSAGWLVSAKWWEGAHTLGLRSLALLPGGRDGGLFEAAAGVSSGVVERKVDSSFIAWSTHGQNCL